MINLFVVNIKTIIKFILKLILSIFVLLIIIKCVKVFIYEFNKKVDLSNIAINGEKIIGENLAIFESDKDTKIEYSKGLKKLLVGQLTVFGDYNLANEETENCIDKTNEEKNVDENITEDVEIVPTDSEVAEKQENLDVVQTSIVQEKNKKDVYTDCYQDVQIKNESKYKLNETMVTPDLKYSNTKDIIIYHTHTCESYTPSDNFNYTATGNYRTTDYNYSVVRVGEELTNYLAGKGYTMVHDKTYHDYPAYNGSYTRSMSTIRNLLSVYNTVDAIFDIHRDALRK